MLKPGQLITGRFAIAARTGVKASTVQHILTRLKTDQQIDQQGGNKNSLITIRNWDRYQNSDQQNDHQMITKRSADDQQMITYKNVEKVNKVKEAEHVAAAPPATTEKEWIDSLKANRAYEGIDVDRELGKMRAWCDAHRKKPTRNRFVNWLNRADKPLSAKAATPTPKPTMEARLI